MSGFERAIGEQKLECTLYIKFHKGEISFTLRDLFNEAALANIDSGIAVGILQDVTTGEQFNLTPALVDNPNLDDEYRISVNPSMDQSFIMKINDNLNLILNTQTKTSAGEEVFKKLIVHALAESSNLKKIEQVFAILVEISTPHH